MFDETFRPLTFETLLSDPLTRLVMEADGVTVAELAAVLYAACEAIAVRTRPFVMPVGVERLAMSMPV